MNRIKLKERAKEFLDIHKGVMLPLSIVAMVGIFIIQFFTMKNQMFIAENGRILFMAQPDYFSSVLTSVISLIVVWSIFVAVRLRGDVTFKTIFEKFTFKKIARTFLVSLLAMVKISLWTLLFIIPGIIKTYEYILVPYIVFEDDNISFREAFAISKEKMHGEKFNFFVLELSFIGWWFLVGITLGLALIYVLPYQCATISLFVSDKLNEPVRKY